MRHIYFDYSICYTTILHHYPISIQLQAQQLFQLSQQEQAFLWQQLRDEAAFDQQSAENSKERGMALLSALYGNAELMRENYNIAIGLGNTLEQIIFGRVL